MCVHWLPSCLYINQGKIPTTHYTNVTIVYTFALWRSMFVPVFQPYTCEHMGHGDTLLLGTAMHLVHLVVCTEMNVPVFQPQAHTHVHVCVYMCVAAWGQGSYCKCYIHQADCSFLLLYKLVSTVVCWKFILQLTMMYKTESTTSCEYLLL